MWVAAWVSFCFGCCLLPASAEDVSTSLYDENQSFIDTHLVGEDQAIDDFAHSLRATFRYLDGKAPIFDSGFSQHVSHTIAFTLGGHDASIALGTNGYIHCVLELERLFNIRYFGWPTDDQFRQALQMVYDRCECLGGCPKSNIDYGLLVMGSYGSESWVNMLYVVEEFWKVDKWRIVNHHFAHAALGFWSSPFNNALVVSYDGGGNDGFFNVYHGIRGHGLGRLENFLGFNFAEPYNMISELLPEVTGYEDHEKMCSDYFSTPRKDAIWLEVGHKRRFKRFGIWKPPKLNYPYQLAGKTMGYAAVGQLSPQIRSRMRSFLVSSALQCRMSNYTRGDRFWRQVPNYILRIACGNASNQQSLAAALQVEFEHLVRDIVVNLFEKFSSLATFDGVVMVGGCALNVLTNQLLQNTLPVDVYVPPAPNDSGESVGAILSLFPPLFPQPLQYLGFRLWDEEILPQQAEAWGAKSLFALGGVEYLARLLAGAEPELRKSRKPIIAVVRGRQEFGPRALGHRSLLAVPDSEDMVRRLNVLKRRQWYRPVAPMIADEALEEVFVKAISSPYMSMAPQVRNDTDVRQRFPALAHFDGTARYQSVGQSDESWVHTLLLAVGKITGLAALINTSFNTKGRPIVNRVSECLDMLANQADLDYVLIEDWLFENPSSARLETLAQKS